MGVPKAVVVQFVGKKVKDKYEMSMVVDNRFTRAFISDSFKETALEQLDTLLSMSRPEDTDLSLTFVVTEPEKKEDE